MSQKWLQYKLILFYGIHDPPFPPPPPPPPLPTAAMGNALAHISHLVQTNGVGVVLGSKMVGVVSGSKGVGVVLGRKGVVLGRKGEGVVLG